VAKPLTRGAELSTDSTAIRFGKPVLPSGHYKVTDRWLTVKWPTTLRCNRMDFVRIAEGRRLP